MRASARHLALACAVFPAAVLLSNPRDAALGPFSVDLAGHLWTGWSAAQGQLPHTRLIGWPDGVDLTPVLGGWLDVGLVGLLSHAVGLILAYNLVVALYLWVAGLGGALLARSLGASAPAALVGGLVLQTDAFVLDHLRGGRPEQVGLGFVALLFGATLRRARGEDSAWLCGLSAALLVYCSWELSLLAGLSLLAMAPALGREGLRRLLPSLGLALLLAGPWALYFLGHAAGARALDEGDFAVRTAARASILVLDWDRRPIGLGLLALLALPWTLRPADRRLGVVAALGLGAAWILALGPSPGLRAPGDLGVGGPFSALQHLPLLGWFHWPDRLLALFSLAAAAASALAVQRAGRAGAIVGLALLLDAGAELRWPRGELRLSSPPALTALAARPEGGAVLDLPYQPDRVRHLGYQLDQITHHRPILFHMVLTHLGAEEGAAWRADPLLGWFVALMDATPPAPRVFGAAELAPMQDQGFDFVVLHQEGWPGDRWDMARRALEQSLGPPVLAEGESWLCWRLAAPGQR